MKFIDQSKPKSVLSVTITMKKFSIIALLICTVVISVVAQKTVLTKDDYARAERMLSFGTAPYVDRGGVRPTFLPDGRFWYRVLTATGSEYVLINPADGSRRSAANLADLGVTAPTGPVGGGRFGGEIRLPLSERSAPLQIRQCDRVVPRRAGLARLVFAGARFV